LFARTIQPWIAYDKAGFVHLTRKATKLHHDEAEAVLCQPALCTDQPAFALTNPAFALTNPRRKDFYAFKKVGTQPRKKICLFVFFCVCFFV
jgi:hypothetical protein